MFPKPEPELPKRPPELGAVIKGPDFGETHSHKPAKFTPNVRTSLAQKVIVPFLCLIVGGAIALGIGYWYLAIPANHVENVFVDINGDSLPDLLVSGEVVYNKGPLGAIVDSNQP